MDTYKGDSPAKKLIRLHLWLHVKSILGERFFTRKHMVLVSREAGDVSVLLGLGVPAKNIVAVDLDSEAIRIASEKFPQVSMSCGDVEEIAKKHKRELASVNLDFCAPASKKLLDKIARIIHINMPERSVLTVGFLAGRERGELKSAVEEGQQEPFHITPEEDWEMLERLRADKEHFEEEEYRLAEELFSRQGQFTKKEIEENRSFFHSFLARADAITQQINDRIDGYPVALSPECRSYYVSRTSSSKGVPMVFLQFLVERPLNPKKTDDFRSKISARRDLRSGFGECEMSIEADERELAAFAASMSTEVGDPALLLNLSKARLSAYKAWKTMGKYDDVSLKGVRVIEDVSGLSGSHTIACESSGFPGLWFPQWQPGETVQIFAATAAKQTGKKVGQRGTILASKISHPGWYKVIVDFGDITAVVDSVWLRQCGCRQPCSGCGASPCPETTDNCPVWSRPHTELNEEEREYGCWHICQKCSDEEITGKSIAEEMKKFSLSRPWESLRDLSPEGIAKAYDLFRRQLRLKS